MKKSTILLIVLLAVVSALSAFALTSCEQPQHEHNFTAAVVEPTCTKSGYTVFTCECGESFIGDFTDALGHDLHTIPAQSATCTEVGWHEYVECSRCDYNTYSEIPASHDLEHVKDKVETCTETGIERIFCHNCDYVKLITVPALGHDLIRKAAKPVTCEESGWNAYELCTSCDYNTYEEIPALGHDMSYSEAKDATCDEIGWNAHFACSRCDYTDREEIPAFGHNWVYEVFSVADCTQDGYEMNTCLNCGRVDELVTPALGHDLVFHAAQEVTCDEWGWEEHYTCSRCDYASEYAKTEPYGHDFESNKIIKETCTTDGLVCETCTRCDYSVESTVPALGHDMKYKTVKEPSCMENGLSYGYCTRCDYSVHKTINKFGEHDLVYHGAQAATCTQSGWQEYYTCTRCDYSDFTEIPPLPHDYFDGYCINCGAQEPFILPEEPETDDGEDEETSGQ